MKPGVILVNRSRGALIERSGLIAALTSGRIRWDKTTRNRRVWWRSIPWEVDVNPKNRESTIGYWCSINAAKQFITAPVFTPLKI